MRAGGREGRERRTYGYCTADVDGSVHGSSKHTAPATHLFPTPESPMRTTCCHDAQERERDQHHSGAAPTQRRRSGTHLEEVVVARVALRVASASVSVRVRVGGALSEMRWLMGRGRRRLAIACSVAGGNVCLRVRR